MGGPSTEHEVSLMSGGVVIKNLNKNKYDVAPVTITKDKKWIIPHHKKTVDVGTAMTWMQGWVDVVFIALHGKYGEDGTVQGLFDFAEITYTGSGVLASALAMDKVKTNDLLMSHKLKVPAYVEVTFHEWRKDHPAYVDRVGKKIGFPCVVKPNNGGSSVGVAIIKKQTELSKAISNAFRFDTRVMVQAFVAGDEVTCAVLDEGPAHGPVALPPTQIIPKTATFFDYKAKYTKGASEEVTPPRLPTTIIKKIQNIAVQTHAIIGCKGFSRTDMMVRGNDIFVLEINTIPGMTETSLYPQAAAVAGILLPDLLDRIINAAFKKRVI